LIGVSEVTGDKEEKTGPNSILLEQGRNTAADLVLDSDGFLRRGLLVLPGIDEKTNTTIGVTSFGLYLAAGYLASEGIKIGQDRKPWRIFLGDVVLNGFEPNDGSYVGIDMFGTEILINWRTPPERWKKVSLFEVLENRISPDLFKDKIVLIGVRSESLTDRFNVPYSRELFIPPNSIYGVEVHANIISYMIRAVLDDRPLIQIIPDWLEYSMITISVLLTISWAGFCEWFFSKDKEKKFNFLLFNF